MSESRLPQQITALLEEHGSLTAFEITRLIGKNRRRVGEVIGRMAMPLRRTPKRIYVIDWVRDVEGGRKYLRAVYAMGDKPDAKKPAPISRTEIQKTSGLRRRTKVQANFVFNLGVGVNRLIAQRKQRVANAL